MAITFSLQNDYGWLTIDPSTGVLTAASTTLISGRFPVTVIENNNGDINNYGFNVQVYHDEASMYGAYTHDTLPFTDLGTQVYTTTAQTRIPVLKSPTNNNWKWFVVYKEAYATVNTDFVIVDTELDTVSQSTNDVEGYGFNLAPYRRSDEHILYINAYHNATTKRKIVTYDPATDTITYDPVVLSTEMNGEQSHMTLDPITRKLLITGSLNDFTHIGEIDTSTNTFNYLAQVGTASAAKSKGLAAGQDLIYTSRTTDTNVELWSVSKDGLTKVLVLSTDDVFGAVDLIQLRGGAMFLARGITGYTDGYYYFLYNNATSLAKTSAFGALNTPPWPDLGGEENYGTEIAYAASVTGCETDAVIPSSGVTDIRVTIDTVPTTHQATVRTYPYALFTSIIDGSDKLMVSGRSTTENVIYNMDTHSVEERFPNATSRTRNLILANGDHIYSGYPSQTTYFKPKGTLSATWLGYAGGETRPSSGHYAHGIAEGSDGLIYIAGIQYRVGDEASISWFNHTDFDNTIDGFHSATDARGLSLVDYGFQNCVAMGGKIVISGYLLPLATPTFSKIFIFDVATKTFDAGWNLANDINSAGYITQVSATDIVGVTALADDQAVIYRMDVTTGTIVYRRDLTGVKFIFGQDAITADYYKIETDEDGYLLVPIVGTGLARQLMRIEPTLGAFEIVGGMPDNTDISVRGKDIYSAANSGNGELYELLNADIPESMPPAVSILGTEVRQFPDFSGDEWANGEAWTLTSGQWIFNNIGTDGMFGANNIARGLEYELVIDIDSLVGNSVLNIRYSNIQGVNAPVGISTYRVTPSLAAANLTIVMAVVTALTDAVVNSLSMKPVLDVFGYGTMNNQTFINNTDGWNYFVDSSYTVAANVATVTGGTTYAGIIGFFQAEIGATYTVTVEGRVGTSVDATLVLYDNPVLTGTPVSSNVVTDGVTFQTMTADILAANDFCAIYLKCSGATLTSEFKNITITKQP